MELKNVKNLTVALLGSKVPESISAGIVLSEVTESLVTARKRTSILECDRVKNIITITSVAAERNKLRVECKKLNSQVKELKAKLVKSKRNSSKLYQQLNTPEKEVVKTSTKDYQKTASVRAARISSLIEGKVLAFMAFSDKYAHWTERFRLIENQILSPSQIHICCKPKNAGGFGAAFGIAVEKMAIEFAVKYK